MRTVVVDVLVADVTEAAATVPSEATATVDPVLVDTLAMLETGIDWPSPAGPNAPRRSEPPLDSRSATRPNAGRSAAMSVLPSPS